MSGSIFTVTTAVSIITVTAIITSKKEIILIKRTNNVKTISCRIPNSVETLIADEHLKNFTLPGYRIQNFLVSIWILYTS